ncbi:ATPase [Aestuariibacter halophilus]|uniref:histidine kinase n=1 Tax=Fluctibacter halophilus TaxID=226011 RepID=A0ABS8G3Z4_9ALTE|nr:ATP-binding protein [Aestuariibacter halophilus]MCC2615253.1 ATPase [Aestuariibacter halophilus]
MTRLSLRLRSFLAATLALLLFIPLTAITLQQGFTNSLVQSMQQQLRIQNLNLIAEFDMQEDQGQMPELLFDEQLNIPGSGVYGFIMTAGTPTWRSLSALNITTQALTGLPQPTVGEELFVEDFDLGSPHFLYAYTAEFPTEDGYQPVYFYVIHGKQTFEAEVDAFSNTLRNWLGLIAVLLLGVLLLSLNTAMRPIRDLIEQINHAERGEKQHIDADYPPELERLKNSINHLLQTEREQRSRYKNSLSDLAHSLKTPLAVLHGQQDLPDSASEPLRQIDRIIQRQLKRAASSGSGRWDTAVAVKPIVEKLKRAMLKVYAEKSLTIETTVDDDARFVGDETDLLELLGNLLDNACKAARQRIIVRAIAKPDGLHIWVEDDGPGIPKQHRDAMLTRGQRLDSYQDGQGIGMAVVSDLLTAYQAQMSISDASLGGAQFHLLFPSN